MNRKIMILILILLLIGVGYLALWAVSGMGIGSGGDQEELNNTKNSDIQKENDALGQSEDGFGDDASSMERSGIVIDKDLLTQKIVIPRGDTEKESTDSISTSTQAIGTSTPTIATSTEIIEPESSTTLGSKTPTSSPTKSPEAEKNASTTEEISQ